MHEFNLIPNEYYQRIRIQHWLKIFAFSYAALICVIYSGHTFLSHLETQQNEYIGTLQQSKQVIISQQKELGGLRKEKQQLKKWHSIFNSLHKGPTAQHLLIALDRVLNNNIWLRQLSFIREEETADANNIAVNTGYLIVVPQELNKGQRQAWRMKTHMTLQGEALDHSTLASLVSDLIDQQEIDDVRITKTASHRYIYQTAVTFEVDLLLNSRSGEHL